MLRGGNAGQRSPDPIDGSGADEMGQEPADHAEPLFI